MTGPGAGFVVGSAGSNLGNLFKPGVLQGAPTTYQMLAKGSQAVQDRLQQPRAEHRLRRGRRAPKTGLLRTIFGTPGETVVRAGFNVAYQRQGMSDLHGRVWQQPGHPDRRHAQPAEQ